MLGSGITGPGSSITGPGSRIRSPGFNIPYANGHLYVTTPTCLHCSPPPACLRCSPPPLTLAYVASYFTAHVANPDVVYDSTAVVLRPERHHHLLRGLKGREGGGRARTIIHQLQSLAGRQGVEGGGQGCKPSPGSGRQAGGGGWWVGGRAVSHHQGLAGRQGVEGNHQLLAGRWWSLPSVVGGGLHCHHHP